MRCRCRPVGPAARLKKGTGRNLQADPPDRRSARESNSVSLPTKEVCCRNTCRPASWESSRQDSNLRYPVCKTGVFAARRRDDLWPAARVGFEPTGTRLSTWPRCRLAYRAIDRGTPNSCGPGSRTPASERMRLGRAPGSPRPRYRAGHAGLMKPGRAPARLEGRVAGGRFELPHLGGTCV